MIILLQLYWSFLKIGFTSFGGLSMIPLITSEMVAHGWLSLGEVSEVVAIAEMTPGPLGLNCATFAGIKTAGMAGSLVAAAGVLTPTFTLCLIVAYFFERSKKSKTMIAVMTGVRPACIGLLAGVIITLCQSNYLVGGSLSMAYILLGLVDAFLLLKCKIRIPIVIGFSAVAGVFLAL